MRKLAPFKDSLLDRQINEIVFYGREGWEDELGIISLRGVGANDPTWKAWSGNFYGYAFEPTTKINEVWIDFHVMHDSNPLQPIFLHVHWSPGNTDTGVVRWGIEFIHSNPDEDFSTTRTIYLEDAGQGSITRHQVVECAVADAIPGNVLIAGGVILTRFFRDATHANDTFTGDAFPHFLNLHYRSDRFGTPDKTGNLYAV